MSLTDANRAGAALLAAVLALVVACWGGVQLAFAVDAGTYEAKLSPSYANPDTGEIEDAGGESQSALGTSMVEGIADPKAVVEVDQSGGVNVTVTFKQAESLGDVKVACDEAKSGSFGDDVTAQAAGAGAEANTAQFTFPVASPEGTLRFKMYVEPMGRDVTFFATLGDFQMKSSGAASAASAAASSASSPAAAASSAAASPATPEPVESASSESAASASSANPVESAPSSDAAAAIEKESGAPSGVHEYTADGHEVTGGQSGADAASQINYPLVIGATVGACALIALIVYLAYFRPRRKAYERAAEAAAPSVQRYLDSRNGR